MVARKAKAPAKPARWTKTRETMFLEHLALSSNVAASERVAGVAVGSAYRQRRGNDDFARAWERALADGYSMLELSMLERAVNGVLVIRTLKDGSTQESRAYPDQIAMTLFRAHRDTVARIRATNEEEGGKAELEDMLAEMARRAGDA